MQCYCSVPFVCKPRHGLNRGVLCVNGKCYDAMTFAISNLRGPERLWCKLAGKCVQLKNQNGQKSDVFSELPAHGFTAFGLITSLASPHNCF